MRTPRTFVIPALLCLFTTQFSNASRADSIPLVDLGTKATAQYHGDGLAITATPDGARLHCIFQKLEAQATPTGLWLDSTVGNGASHFQVVAQALGRTDALQSLASSGEVLTSDNLVRLVRPQVTEEYSVSVDGVRQDFVIATKPAGTGKLQLALTVAGARAENSAPGVQLALDGSNRKIAYGKLQATDAAGHTLRATLTAAADHRLLVTVDDAQAEYPVRIDPTFSDANWVNPFAFPGANSPVNAMATDGLGDIYLGGAFTVFSSVTTTSHLVEWNGTSWSAVGGSLNSTVRTLLFSGGNLYVGGQFSYATNAGVGIPVYNIAQWNGSTWSAIGGGVNGTVDSLVVSGTNLYAGGSFAYATNAGTGLRVNYIAQWNGNTWSAFGGGVNSQVNTLTILGTNVYAGGEFTYATNSGGVALAARYIAQWNGNTWTALGGGMNNWVNTLAIFGTNLYAGGSFNYATNAGVGTVMGYIAQWNGNVWSSVGGGLALNSQVNALMVSSTNLYVGGIFNYATNTGGAAVAADDIAAWNGTAWSTIGGGAVGGVSTLAMLGTNLYAGGTFNSAGNVSASGFAFWNGASWSGVGMGFTNGVNALAVYDNNLYVGGQLFTGVGDIPAFHIAQWDGSAWLTVGGGLNNGVEALAVSGTNLYAGGSFNYATNSDGTAVAAEGIAAWNGAAWSTVGGSLNNSVIALASDGTNLYAGGVFTYATNGSTSLHTGYVAEWNGASWLAFGGGLNGAVETLAITGTNLYAGGNFSYATNAGVGTAAKYIAQWNGTQWLTLGGGINNFVNALAILGTNVYVGGGFTYATNAGTGFYAGRIAQWNGAQWLALGGGMNNIVSALAIVGTNLYVSCGTYATNSNVGVPVNFLAAWDGANWYALGSGLSGSSSVLLASGNDLYVGGTFTLAGTNVSACLAEYANLGTVVVPPPGITSANVAGGTYGSAFSYTITASNSPTSFGASGLPSGVSVDSASGIISGLPSQSGNYTPIISATNVGGYGTLALNLTITQANLTVSGLTANNLVYNSTTNASLNFSGASLQGLVFSDPVTLDQTDYNAYFSAPDAGNNLPVTIAGLNLDGVQATNYTLTLPTGLTANITPAPVTVSLNTSEQAYDGTAKSVSPTTSVTNLPVTITYNGSSTVPSAAGAYTVVVTVNNPDYSGSTTNNLYIVGPPLILSALTNSTTGQFVFTWTAVPGATYQVIDVPDLSQAWTDLYGPVAATNSIMTTTDPLLLTAPTNRFYRVQAVLQ